MSTRLERLMFAIGMRDEASSKMGKLRKAITGMTETVHDQFLRVGTGAMGAFGAVESVGRLVAPAIDLNRAIGEVASLGVDTASLKLLEDASKGFAMEYGGTAAEVVRASYDIQSAISGLSGKELSSFTVASGILAKGTKADVATITDYMGTMYGVYQQQAEKMGRAQWVDQIAGKTAQAVNMFKTNGTKWAQGISTLGASATAAGIAMEEQFAVLGNLQLVMGGSEAATKYNAFLTGALGAQSKLGLDFFNKDGTMKSIVDVFSLLRGKFGETLDDKEKLSLKNAFGSDEALKFIDLLMSKQGQLATDMAKLGSVKGLGPAQEMAAKMTDVWSKIGGATNVLAASFGQVLLPPLADLGTKALSVINTLQRWVKIAPNIARPVGLLVIGVIGLGAAMGVLSASIAVSKIAWLALGGPIRMVVGLFGLLRKLTILQTAVQWLFNTSLYGCPMIWVVIGVGLLIAAVGALIYRWDDLKAAFLDTSWGKAIMAVIDSLMAPFKALGDTWDWVSEKFGFGGSTEVTAKAQAAAKASELPAAPGALKSLEAPRASEVPVGGVLAGNSIQNRSNTRQTTIGSVNIHSEQPLTPGQLNEYVALQAG